MVKVEKRKYQIVNIYQIWYSNLPEFFFQIYSKLFLAISAFLFHIYFMKKYFKIDNIYDKFNIIGNINILIYPV